MVNLVNSIKALVVCVLTTSIYTLYTSTSNYQQLLAREGQEVGKIEALMHYSTLSDVWSRMLSGWFSLFVICFITCFLLLFWVSRPDKAIK